MKYKRHKLFALRKNQNGSFLSLYISSIVCSWLHQMITKITSISSRYFQGKPSFEDKYLDTVPVTLGSEDKTFIGLTNF